MLNNQIASTPKTNFYPRTTKLVGALAGHVSQASWTQFITTILLKLGWRFVTDDDNEADCIIINQRWED
uniref:Uncharacterized protein n=1 Tax=Romanomermis culicivorax TaxID=13658 RepID=A0A915ID13_ROMCU